MSLEKTIGGVSGHGRSRPSWAEGAVDERGEHLELSHNDHPTAVALIGRWIDGCFPVRFLVPRQPENDQLPKVVADVVRELDLYLCELCEPDPWRYAVSRTRPNTHSRFGLGSNFDGPREALKLDGERVLEGLQARCAVKGATMWSMPTTEVT